jgi:serine/threonine protein kinase
MVEKGDILGNYKLMQTLGSGTYSKVKLAIDINTGKRYAIKIHKAEKFNKSIAEVLDTELKTLNKLQGISPYVVNLIDYIPTAEIHKANGKTQQVVCVMVDEICTGGELFFYVKNGGYFPEPLARHYFR